MPHDANMERRQVDRPLVERLARALEPRAEILEAYLFGSRARGDAHSQSDVDVDVYIDEARADSGPFGYQADLTTYLMDALQTNAIDVVVLNRAPILLYHRVLRDGVRLLTRDLRATTTRPTGALALLRLPPADGEDGRRAARHGRKGSSVTLLAAVTAGS